MKINTLDTPLLSSFKKDAPPMTTGEGEAQRPWLVRDALVTTLNTLYKAEGEVSGEEKYKRAKLCRRIDEAEGEVELKSEEIVLIKKLIGMYPFSPLITEQLYDALEGV